MVKPGVLVALPWQKLDSQGPLTDEETRKFLHKHLEAFAERIAQVGAPREALVV